MKSHPKIIDRILEKIRDSRTICVGGHIRPDGDCIGSQLALALALRGKARVFAGTKMPCPKIRLPHPATWCKNQSSPDFDLVIALDCASFERLGSMARCRTPRLLIILTITRATPAMAI